MIKIFTNHNKQDIVYSFSIGQVFPDILGKLLKIEINGNELLRLNKEKEIPISSIDTSYIIWHNRNAGRIIKILREIFWRI